MNYLIVPREQCSYEAFFDSSHRESSGARKTTKFRAPDPIKKTKTKKTKHATKLVTKLPLKFLQVTPFKNFSGSLVASLVACFVDVFRGKFSGGLVEV